MSDIDIQVCQLSKKYRLGYRRTALRRTLKEALSQRFGWQRRQLSPIPSRLLDEEQEIWALRNINLEIKRGDSVGIVGRNGAGKSTLLKILARITEPTEGHARVRGRTTSVLEVGTGFHHELSGRENIYLNGTILGMKRDEIKQRFSQIVEFSGVSKFIDTPVKHYSSGMRVRLAFSIAAHLQPDILFIDEVLAVGDFEFQQKCLAKMKDVLREGRTVVFVSHNLAAIKEMCRKGVFLDQGNLGYFGPIDEALARYFLSLTTDSAENVVTAGWWNISVNGNGEATSTINGDEAFSIQAGLKLDEDFVRGHVFFKMLDTAGNALVRERINASDLISQNLLTGMYHVELKLPALWLAPSIYVVRFWFMGHTRKGEEKRYDSSQMMINVAGSLRGLDYARVFLDPPLAWKMNYASSATQPVQPKSGTS